ncbi:hypothetical protein ACIOGZ_28920 [Kitasatospora sp. NPDC088160]|uniref:hypothetical protein n=1 Tax=Kitasatospora sp. NPDC088160 TaxID=3364072 RepID=UPI003818E994
MTMPSRRPHAARGCLPEHADVATVRSVLDILAGARIPRADLASEEDHQADGTGCGAGAVVTPNDHRAGVTVQWYEDGTTDEAGLPTRRVPTVRGMRNRALDECASLLMGFGYSVTSSASPRTRTRRVQSLLVCGEPSELATTVAHALAAHGFAPVGVLPLYWDRPDWYQLASGSETLSLSLSHATPVERVRDAVAALRVRGLNANEDQPRPYGNGYGILVRKDKRPTGERDGLLPDTPECRAAREVLWLRGFSRENTEHGTIGHRVYPQLTSDLRSTSTVGSTPAFALPALHDKVSVTAPDTAYAEGRGRELATALSAAHEEAFTAVGWRVVREDPITITVCRRPASEDATEPDTTPADAEPAA